MPSQTLHDKRSVNIITHKYTPHFHSYVNSWGLMMAYQCLLKYVHRNYSYVVFTTHRTVTLPVVLYGSESLSLALTEVHSLGLFNNRVLRKILWPEKREITGE